MRCVYVRGGGVVCACCTVRFPCMCTPPLYSICLYLLLALMHSQHIATRCMATPESSRTCNSAARSSSKSFRRRCDSSTLPSRSYCLRTLRMSAVLPSVRVSSSVCWGEDEVWHACGAHVYHPQYVLEAAHCIRRRVSMRLFGCIKVHSAGRGLQKGGRACDVQLTAGLQCGMSSKRPSMCTCYEKIVP